MDIPESDTPRPHTLEDPFAELRSKIGITEGMRAEVRAAPAAEGDPFMRHDAFEAQTDATGRTRYPDPTDCEGTLRVLDDSGALWPCVCDRCGFEVGVQVQRIDPERLVERRLARAGLPEAFVGKTFERMAEQEQTREQCRRWIAQFKRDPLPGIVLYGKAGRGKSHLLSLMVETVIRNYGVDGIYRSAAELFQEQRDAIERGGGQVAWQRVLRAPLLALDDLASVRTTPWRHELLLALLDYRYTKGLPIIAATNLPPAAWESEFGDRIRSRLRGLMLPFELSGPDRRMGMGVQQSFAA